MYCAAETVGAITQVANNQLGSPSSPFYMSEFTVGYLVINSLLTGAFNLSKTGLESVGGMK